MSMKRATVAVVVGFLLALSGLIMLAFFPARDPYVWGYWQEDGQVFSQGVLLEKIEEAPPAEAERFISELCGEPVRFRQGDETIQTEVWPDPTLVRHFLLSSPFASVVWVTVISPQYACSALADSGPSTADCGPAASSWPQSHFVTAPE
jgi:hypothetical protein